MRYYSLDVVLERVEAIQTYEQDPRRAGRGARFDAALMATFQRIDASPRAAPRFPGISVRSVRRAKVMRFPYSVLYFLDHGEPVIVAIAHGRREPLYWRSRIR